MDPPADARARSVEGSSPGREETEVRIGVSKDDGSVAEWVMLLIFAAGVVLALVAVVGPRIVEFAKDAVDAVNGTGP